MLRDIGSFPGRVDLHVQLLAHGEVRVQRINGYRWVFNYYLTETVNEAGDRHIRRSAADALAHLRHQLQVGGNSRRLLPLHLAQLLSAGLIASALAELLFEPIDVGLLCRRRLGILSGVPLLPQCL